MTTPAGSRRLDGEPVRTPAAGPIGPRLGRTDQFAAGKRSPPGSLATCWAARPPTSAVETSTWAGLPAPNADTSPARRSIRRVAIGSATVAGLRGPG
jgi:hypothetical protein